MLKKGLYQGLFLLADFLWCCSRSKSLWKIFLSNLACFLNGAGTAWFPN